MVTLENEVASHYVSKGLLARIDDAFKEMGTDPDHLTIDDLKPVDEFHTGGLEATNALLDQLEITADMVVIDLGCGLGGTARHIVHRYGATVQGVDLTEDYVKTGQALNQRLLLQERIDLRMGSATDLPFADASADLVTMFHVGMNIADKAQLFEQAARVLKPGGHFAVFDVMRDTSDEELEFPVPWSSGPETNNADLPKVYHDAATAAGFTLLMERERRQFTLDFFDRSVRKIAAEGMPPLGVHLLMGASASEKIKNYIANVKANRVAPIEMIFKCT